MIRSRTTQGFTVVEVAVVLFIIGLLATVGSLSYSAIQATSRNAEASEQLAKFGRTLVKYKADHGAYPSSTDALVDEYAVQFKTDLFSTDSYYNLLYCSTSPHSSYVLTAITKNGKRIFVKNADSPDEYTGPLTWSGSDASNICDSVLTGATAAGPAGWREAGEAPIGWRPWVNGNN